MSLKELKEELNQDVKNILSSDFTLDIIETTSVPTISDANITYPNLDTKSMKAKQIQTCVLYIDIRKSTDLNLKHRPQTLTKLYASFMRTMVKASQHYGGKVRNIIGDRVMVIFDEDNCFKNAVNTAILLNSVAIYTINKNFTSNEITCGIGVDYGRMLVSKGGIVKSGTENAPYKSLVWLGRPANVASKLTDLANKVLELKVETELGSFFIIDNRTGVEEFYTLPFKSFFSNGYLSTYNMVPIRDSNGEEWFYSKEFSAFPRAEIGYEFHTYRTPNILITEIVYNEYKKACPYGNDVKKEMWKLQDPSLYSTHKVYGGDIIFIDYK